MLEQFFTRNFNTLTLKFSEYVYCQLNRTRFTNILKILSKFKRELFQRSDRQYGNKFQAEELQNQGIPIVSPQLFGILLISFIQFTCMLATNINH